MGCPLAYLKKCRFIPARKPNKLPRPVIRANYKLEYGINSIEISKGDIRPNDRVLVVDDIIATGGTVKAILGLIKKSKAKTVGCMFISEVPGTKGLEKIEKSGTKAYLAIK
ncbi:MAG: hypothetical protein K2M43_03180 [Mycoplasmoidaceae bacterium]|nr:hypothetical protein [Mycoplasmoidaceae bacterium]